MSAQLYRHRVSLMARMFPYIYTFLVRLDCIQHALSYYKPVVMIHKDFQSQLKKQRSNRTVGTIEGGKLWPNYMTDDI